MSIHPHGAVKRLGTLAACDSFNSLAHQAFALTKDVSTVLRFNGSVPESPEIQPGPRVFHQLLAYKRKTPHRDAGLRGISDQSITVFHSETRLCEPATPVRHSGFKNQATSIAVGYARCGASLTTARLHVLVQIQL